MEDQTTVQKALAKRIATLEMDIAAWRSCNSQSNPGAMMELRSMKKDLEAAYKAFHASIVLAASTRPVADTRKPGEQA
jgi:hypothetical protein